MKSVCCKAYFTVSNCINVTTHTALCVHCERKSLSDTPKGFFNDRIRSTGIEPSYIFMQCAVCVDISMRCMRSEQGLTVLTIMMR